MKFREIVEQARTRIKHPPGTLVDHGHVMPQGIFATAEIDYDMSIVKHLIRKGQLAPFYEGLNEPCKNYHNELEYDIECPICFLFYPSKLNRTRCCDKSICTECFLQLRRSAHCPFCVQPNFGVLYIPPSWSKYYSAFKKKRSNLIDQPNNKNDRRHWVIEPNDPDVILIDTVRPKWDEISEEFKTSSVGSTRRRRVRISNDGLLDNQQNTATTMTTDNNNSLEDIIVMEAIRVSLLNSNHNNNA